VSSTELGCAFVWDGRASHSCSSDYSAGLKMMAEHLVLEVVGIELVQRLKFATKLLVLQWLGVSSSHQEVLRDVC
jgi:hypothetical protein